MTIDERIERLTERHEALTQSVELLLVATRENTDHIRKLVEVTNRDAEDIRALARIAEIHDRRITGIEGGRAISHDLSASLATDVTGTDNFVRKLLRS
jgi:hypothetical protein